MTGITVEMNTYLLASLCDSVNGLIYMLSDSNGDKPESLSDQFVITKTEKHPEHEVFYSGNDFKKRREELLNEIRNSDS